MTTTSTQPKSDSGEQVLSAAKAKAADLRAKADLLSKPRNDYETDMATVSGIRRKPNRKADAARFARFDREAEAWRLVDLADREVQRLERAAIANPEPVPFTNDELRAARLIRTRHGWHKVARINAKRVSVATGYSWTDRVALSKIMEVRT